MWTLISSFFFSFSLSSSLNLSNSLYSFFFAPTERWGGSGGGWPAGAAAPPRRNPNNLFFWFFFLLPSSLPFLVSFLTSEFQDKLPTVLDLRDSIVKKGYYLWFGFWFGLRLARSRLPFFLLSNSVLDAVLRVDGRRDWIVCWWFCWLKIRCWLCVFWLQVWWWLLDSPEFGDVALMGFDGHGGVAYGWIGSSLWLSVCALLCGLCAFCRVDAMLRFRFLYCSCVLLYFLCVFLVVLQVVFIMWFGTRVCCWWAKKQWLGGGERGNALLTACLDLLQMRREFVWVGWGWNTPWQPVWICSRGKNGCLLLFAMNLDHFGRFWDFGQFRDLKKKEK